MFLASNVKNLSSTHSNRGIVHFISARRKEEYSNTHLDIEKEVSFSWPDVFVHAFQIIDRSALVWVCIDSSLLLKAP